MSQSRAGSLVEAVTNTAAGFGINLTANMIVLPFFGYQVTLHDALGIGVVFTVISVVRSFVLRRAFNAITMRRRG